MAIQTDDGWKCQLCGKMFDDKHEAEHHEKGCSEGVEV